MFRILTLKKMEAKALEVIEANKDAFDKYKTDVQISTKTNAIHTRTLEGVSYVVGFGQMKATMTDHENPLQSILNSLEEITFGMNSIYIIAKGIKIDPMLLVERIIEEVADDLRIGIYPKRAEMFRVKSQY